ncbi:Holliday junction resolvase-like protein [Flexithrix dorotheae]|uniref:Holliday junction resolvase-like protein n=1 Tax=Flexithrix dorotheae TaxID=70993 RepID=UPI00037D2D57|nr:Holliday junction resolvase-like protein [Flexithrix dorotheae]
MEWVIIGILTLIIFILLLRKRGDIADRVELEADKLFKEWVEEEVPIIREEAIKSSQAVTMGKSIEQLLPYFTDFPFNPKDVRFLGSPIDLVVFDGLSEGELRQVVFVEVKTGKNFQLPAREKQVKECINSRKVRWHLIHHKK